MKPIHQSQLSWKGLSKVFVILLVFSLPGCATQRSKHLSQSDRARFLVDIAGGALQEGDVVGALQHLAMAEELDSTIPELYHIQSLAFHAKGDQKMALASARKAVRLAPQLSNANNTLGKLLLDEAKYAEAEPFLRKAAADSLNREAYKALTNLGILYYRKGESQKSRDFFNKAVQASKAEACVAFYYKGHLELKEGRLPGAISHYHSASNQLCSGFAEAHLALAMTYEKSGQYDLARRKYLEIQQQFNSTQYAQKAIDQLKNLP